jgi:hypothetical protein
LHVIIAVLIYLCSNLSPASANGRKWSLIITYGCFSIVVVVVVVVVQGGGLCEEEEEEEEQTPP